MKAFMIILLGVMIGTGIAAGILHHERRTKAQEIPKVESSKRVMECWKTVHYVRVWEGGNRSIQQDIQMRVSFKGLEGNVFTCILEDFDVYMKLREGLWYEVEYVGDLSETPKVTQIAETEKPYAEFKPEDY